MEKYSFFNDVDGDRVYYAEDVARHLATYFTNGIFNNGCQVLGDINDMAVNVQTGSANINGYRYDNDSIKTLIIDNADGVLNRIDNIVIRLDLTNRLITTQVVKGTFANSPTAPDLVRTSTIYDLRIAKISIPAGTTEITQDLITDTRFITSDCGNVISTVETPDTENLFIQIQAAFEKELAEMDTALTSFDENASTLLTNSKQSVNELLNTGQTKINDALTVFDTNSAAVLKNSQASIDELLSDSQTTFDEMISADEKEFKDKMSSYDTTFDEKISIFNTDFDTWFSNIKDKLDGDTAGNLQNEIDTINNTISDFKYIEDDNYVHTDNNFTDEYKQKIDTNVTNIEKIVNNGCKSYDVTLTMDMWQLDSSDNSYYYDVARGDITESTDVTISMSRLNKAKFKGLTDVKSYSGGFKITTDEMPEEDIDVTVKYMLANMMIGGNE